MSMLHCGLERLRVETVEDRVRRRRDRVPRGHRRIQRGCRGGSTARRKLASLRDRRLVLQPGQEVELLVPGEVVDHPADRVHRLQADDAIRFGNRIERARKSAL